MCDRSRANKGGGTVDGGPQLARIDLVEARQMVATKVDVKGTIGNDHRCYGESLRGNKKENQDTFCIIPNFCGNANNAFIGVFDGHGGAGAHMSMWVRTNLPKYLEEEYVEKKRAPREALVNAFNRTHAEMDRKCQAEGSQFEAEGSGTTASVAWFFPDRVWVASVGDSAVALGWAGEGNELKAAQITPDHRPEIPEERLRIEGDPKGTGPGRVEQRKNDKGKGVGPFRVYMKDVNFPGLMVSRSLGDTMAHRCGCSSEPYVYEHVWSAVDKYMILASDGLWDVMDATDAMQIAHFQKRSNSAANHLCEEAIKKRSNDNTTAVHVIIKRANSGVCSLQ